MNSELMVVAQKNKVSVAGVAQLGEQQTEVSAVSGGPVFNPRSWHFIL